MRRLAPAVFVLLVPAWHAAAQVTIQPDTPRWGDTIMVTVAANRDGDEARRLSPGDHPFLTLLPTVQGVMPPSERLWVPLTWNGQHFTAQMKVPAACEVGLLRVITAERSVAGTERSFLCHDRNGQVPPGAIVSALAWGSRDRANWRDEAAADMTALRQTADPGWGHAVLWLFRLGAERETFTREALLRDVVRVDREETRRTPGLLSALVFGYDRGGDTATAFTRLKELCERYPESPFTTRDALRFAAAAAATRPEFDADLGRLLASVAARAPHNRGLRDSMARLIANQPEVPLATIRTIATDWMRDRPAQMAPHYFLAAALLQREAAAARDRQEAEALLTTAIDLSLRPHPLDAAEQTLRQRAFGSRSTLRADRQDIAGAIADARMAQLVARDRIGAADMAAEAALWHRAGHVQKAETLALDAYRLGSLEAEPLLRQQFVSRTGSESGFSEFLVARLRQGALTPLPALRPTPAFAVKTLDNASVDSSALGGRITVLDFWFIGCAPCRIERPKLNALVDEFGGRIRFVGFALDPAGALRRYQAETPFKYEIVPDSEAIAKTFGVEGFPRHMVLDREGRIVWMSGSEDDRVERLRAMIVRVLAGEK